MISDFIKKVHSGEIDPVEHTKQVIKATKELNEKYNFMNEISEQLALEQAKAVKTNPKGKLAGVPVSVKDCIVVKDVESRAGSTILDSYIPVFNATAIQKVIDEGGIIIGKTAQDAFGFGSFSVNVGVGRKIPKNPIDKSRSCGGSSGGSGGITAAADFPHISLGESTGGSIEAPASFCGVVGFCPTYGLVSRYGLMDYGNSLDKIGPMSKSIKDTALMLNIITGYDENDSTSIKSEKVNYTKTSSDVKGLKIGIIKEYMTDDVDSEILESINNTKTKLEKGGAKVEEVSLPTTAKFGLSTYYIIAMSEASTNLSKYCGLRYGKSEPLKGNFNEYFKDVRSKNFNAESKRRIIVGTFARMSGVRDAYYIKAAKVRTLIIQEYKGLFKKYDLLISPVTPTVAPKFDEIKNMTPMQNYMADIMTVGPNLAGIPHMSYPIGENKEGLPIGMMVSGDHLNEEKLIQLGQYLEK